MTDVVLAIKPKYAALIYNGTKTAEYRKMLPNKMIYKWYIYESAPVSAVTGYFTDKYIYESHLDDLWRFTHASGGIDRATFDAYFRSRLEGKAILIKDVVKFAEPVKIAVPPQNFRYMKDGEVFGNQ